MEKGNHSQKVIKLISQTDGSTFIFTVARAFDKKNQLTLKRLTLLTVGMWVPPSSNNIYN